MAGHEGSDGPSVMGRENIWGFQGRVLPLKGGFLMPPVAMAEVLRCVVGAGERSLQEGLYEERQGVLRGLGTKDSQEGMMAFLEKRKPKFTGE